MDASDRLLFDMVLTSVLSIQFHPANHVDQTDAFYVQKLVRDALFVASTAVSERRSLFDLGDDHASR